MMLIHVLLTIPPRGVTCIQLTFFFFSSRRRHTRCLSDWSSDVCSSDLYVQDKLNFRKDVIVANLSLLNLGAYIEFVKEEANKTAPLQSSFSKGQFDGEKIGRASCRERV